MNTRLLVKASILVVLVLAIVGVLVAVSGVLTVAASKGHWQPTEWFLQFGKRRSVSTHSLGIEIPSATLDDHARIVRGASAYELGCKPCHGGPGAPPPMIARAMLPPPPALGSRMAEWDTEELFFIVKHGLKMTGMPAWPDLHRDDEVWDLTAFLLVLPALDEAGYRQLAYGELQPAQSRTAVADLDRAPRTAGEGQHPGLAVQLGCAQCHGRDGRGRNDGPDAGAFPVLAGQREEYLYGALRAYATSGRHSGVMGPIAERLDEAAMRSIAREYSSLAPGPPTGLRVAVNLRQAGEEIALHGIPAQDVPSCVDCHGPTSRPRRAAYPLLAGQPAAYLTRQLQLFAADRRGGSEWGHLMLEFADKLRPDQIEAVTAYYSSLANEAPQGR